MRMTILIVALLTTLNGALAADFTAPITNIDGTTPTGADGKPVELTLRKVCVDALLTQFPDEQSTLTGEEKIRRFTLAKNIQSNLAPALTSEDTALVKKMVAKAYGPLIVGQAWDLLEQKK